MRLLLIRHGQTPSNVTHQLDTAHPGAGLSELGLRQAAAVPGALEQESIGVIYASTLRRTQQTARPLAHLRGLPIVVHDGLREIAAGDLEMRSDRSAIETYIEVVFGWDTEPERRMPGGESGREVMERFDSAITEAVSHPAVAGGAAAAVFAHGAVIRVWTAARATNVDMGYAADHWLPNTAMVTLEGDPQSGWTLVDWTEHALGGPELSDPAHTGPAGEPEELTDADDVMTAR